MASRTISALSMPGSATSTALRNLTRLIEEGLHLRLRAKTTSSAIGPVRLPVFKGRGGLVAGVDPLSNKGMLEALGDDA